MDINLYMGSDILYGYASFQEEKETHGIPVLWIIDNECVDPPWGKVARIDVNK